MRSKFDQQLALLNEELTQMGETCAKAICLAAQALEAQDAATAAPVRLSKPAATMVAVTSA